jgi:hypothetical protein
MSTDAENTDSTGTLGAERMLALIAEFMREVRDQPAVPEDQDDDDAWARYDDAFELYSKQLRDAAGMTIGALRAQGWL